ncbi:hypothetical protein P0E69_20485 (plasmid) [Chimaeribacter arupi]|uniref:Uncharacterized protein n=2 Tax=Yersiniaceae TaxID=1903411 RepID=A0A2N5EMI3_9GAMM|nr:MULTISPECIES: hypothetical protein [Yersiniaceae]MBS0968640.1 hypothetical protein [Nissabacter archeti]MDV5139739.1 hypothetical protein [Chimaeribacter arupi]PLR49281.1 hypothetical protein CYR34_11355 [Chimaeribacter arupi]WKZ94616.1 hypothetical protein P0E69_20485 [Chimaeribacter arupi]
MKNNYLRLTLSALFMAAVSSFCIVARINPRVPADHQPEKWGDPGAEFPAFALKRVTLSQTRGEG